MATAKNQGMLTRAEMDRLLARHLDNHNTHALRALLKTVRDRAEDMDRLPWPALRDSWLDTEATVRQVLEAVQP